MVRFLELETSVMMPERTGGAERKRRDPRRFPVT
jgi:hypothetical protein